MNSSKLMLVLAAAVLFGLVSCGGEQPEADAAAEEPAPEEPVIEEPEPVRVVDPADEVAEPEMTEEEKLARVMEDCICPQCPSWIPEAAEKGEGGYCATGMSECIVDEVGCVCPDRPVMPEMGLEWGYYCTRGSVAEMQESQEGE